MTPTKNRACSGKLAFPTRWAAQQAVWSLVRGGAAPSAYVAYRCRWGAHWHFGHRMGRRR